MTISIIDDDLILDAEFCVEWKISKRTAARYEKEPDGLPYVMLGGRKYRPVRACQEWLARRIRRPNPRRAA